MPARAGAGLKAEGVLGKSNIKSRIQQYCEYFVLRVCRELAEETNPVIYLVPGIF